jgi:acyl-CoA thioesterase FadM
VTQTVTIRFAHVDAAGIVFYPRYFELLARVFPESELASPPFAMRTEFLRPNRLGDQLRIIYEREQDGWRYSGRMDDVEYFRIASLAKDEQAFSVRAHRTETTAFRTNPGVVGAWASDASGHMSVSHYFELVSDTIELWFEAALDLPFQNLHATKMRVPTVRFTTRCRTLPRTGEEVAMWMRPVHLGNKSVTFRSWLVRGDECLIDNEQVIVFVEIEQGGFRGIPVPEKLRARIEAQIAAGDSAAGARHVAS